MAHQEVHGVGANLDREVGVILRRQPEDLEVSFVVERRAVRVHREQRSRHVLPQERLEVADVGAVYRILRVDDERELAGEEPEPERVAGTADHSVLVDRDDSIDGRLEHAPQAFVAFP